MQSLNSILHKGASLGALHFHCFSIFDIPYSIFYSPCSSYSILHKGFSERTSFSLSLPHVYKCTFVFVLVCFLCLYLYLYAYLYLFLYLCLNSILHKGFSGCTSFSLFLPPDCIQSQSQSQSQSHTIPITIPINSLKLICPGIGNNFAVTSLNRT